MKLIVSPKYAYSIYIFDIDTFLTSLKDNNIKVFNIKRIDKYNYYFDSSLSNHKKLLKLYPSLKIIKKKGLFFSILNLLKYKTTIISLVISILFYYSLSQKIWIINIKGDDDSINEIITSELKRHNIFVGASKISTDQLSEIQKDILFNNFNIIEYLSIDISGCKVDVSFKEKRKENEQTHLKKSLYAKKDGMIKSFDLLSGEKVVDINDYVKKDDLLVKDILTTDYNEEVYIGTYGSVYAYTWYYVTLESKVSSNISHADLFANSMLMAKNQISKDFNDNEYIYEENVLQFNVKDNNMFLKIHFTCVEDIAKE